MSPLSWSHDNYDEFNDMLNSVLLHISKWFRANHHTLNVKKTKALRFTPNKLIQCGPGSSVFRGTDYKLNGPDSNSVHNEQASRKVVGACCSVYVAVKVPKTGAASTRVELRWSPSAHQMTRHWDVPLWSTNW